VLTDAPLRWPAGVTLLVLSGGASRRLGRDKASSHVGGRPLLDRILAAVPPEVPVVLVGPAPDPPDPRWHVVREDPPGSGPAAGIGAGAAACRTDLVGVLAADMPFAVPVVVGALTRLAAARVTVDAVLPTDADGRRQPLCAAYRSAALRGRLAALGPVAGRAVRDLLDGLHVMEWPVPAADLADVDTAAELHAARARASQEGSDMQDWVEAVRRALALDVAVDIDAILDVARDAAHNVERPAAPLTTYLLGAAIARGADPAEAAATVSALALDWPDAGRDA
jgi:molybdopterin-guanine dinucleotide biosynthesis protein A